MSQVDDLKALYLERLPDVPGTPITPENIRDCFDATAEAIGEGGDPNPGPDDGDFVGSDIRLARFKVGTVEDASDVPFVKSFGNNISSIQDDSLIGWDVAFVAVTDANGTRVIKREPSGVQTDKATGTLYFGFVLANAAVEVLKRKTFTAGDPGGGGLPEGGTTGQVLAKASNADGDAVWINAPEGSGGSVSWDNIAGKPTTFAPAVHPLSQISQSGATTGQVVRWNGTAWVASDESVKFLGMHATVAALYAAYPSATAGSMAIVLADLPRLYLWTDSDGWIPSYRPSADDFAAGLITPHIDGDKVRLDLTWDLTVADPDAIPNQLNALVSMKRAKDTFYTKDQIDQIIANLGGGGGGFDPIALAKIAGVWESDSGITNVSGGVNAWADRSALAHNFSAFNSTLRPIFHANGGPNNKAYLQFDGTKALQNTSFSLPSSTNKITVFMVARVQFPTPVAVVVELTPDGNTNPENFIISAETTPGFNSVAAVILGNVGGSKVYAGVNNSWNVFRFEFDKSKTTQEALPFVNGEVGTTPEYNADNDNTDGFASSAPLFLGARNNTQYPATIDVAAMVIVSDAGDATTTQQVETYLSLKYGISV